MTDTSDPKSIGPTPRETSGQLMNDQFRIRRFKLIDGEEVSLYCRLIKFRAGVAAAFYLYEDRQGLKWLNIACHDESFLVAITDKPFEQYVADELLTLGFNKYSG